MIKTIERKDGKRYQVYGRRNGQKVYVSTHDTRKEAIAADEAHRVLQRQIKDGELPPEVDGKRLLGPALDEWLKAIAKQRSHYAYSSRVENYVKPALGDQLLAKVTAAKLERMCVDLDGRVSRGTIDGVLAMLGAAWSYFIRRGWAGKGTSPVPDVELKGLVADKVKHPVEWIRDTADVTKLLAACNANIRTLVAVLVGTGMRIDEALHLEWSDIHLEHRQIAITRGRKGAPKSGKARTIPILDPVVLGVLGEMKAARGKNRLLWPSPARAKDGAERVRDQSGVHRPFKAALVRAGLPKKLRIHDLRHTFAGLYLTAGGDIYRLSKILGHHSVKVTQDTYAHLAPHAFEQDYGRVSFAMPSTSATPATGYGRDTAH